MPDDNKRNLQYFEASSMRELFDTMQSWQDSNKKRLLSLSVQKDGDKFCCIALTNPSEVTIVSGQYEYSALVSKGGALRVIQS